MPKLHPSITVDRVIDAVKRSMRSLDDPGFCLACGEEVTGCGPDARNYKCESCGERRVFGAEEIMLCVPEFLKEENGKNEAS